MSKISPYDLNISGNSDKITEKTGRAIIEYLLEHPDFKKRQLTALKCKIGKKFHFKNVIKDSQILSLTTEEEREKLVGLLKRRATRTISGVTIVAVMTKPYECPGKCVYCPGPDSQPGKKVAQSYTGREPAAMRSAMYDYDPYEQTFHRLTDIQAIGHEVDKLELIIMGGTFFYTPIEFQNEFVKGCYDAIINFSEPNFNDHTRSPDLSTAKKRLENSKTRLIGLTFETRPDYCTREFVDRMLELGATRVEIGIQTTDEIILEKINRGHKIQASIEAIQVAKDAGLKVNAHMMPNLPGSSPERDIEDFRELFSNSNFRPDMLKIYPTLVIGGTKLYHMYKSGEYTPYSQEKIVEVVSQIKTEIPSYVRIQRIQRDIPADLIIDGVKNSNLRQIVQRNLKAKNLKCNCIRCREEGFFSYNLKQKEDAFDINKVELMNFQYEASEGKEYFISFEEPSKNVLVGYLRLRFPSKKAHRPEIANQKTAIVREIRVVGEMVKHAIAPKEGQIQHRGYGKKLIQKAEDISKENGMEKLIIISGIGARPYFYKLGYQEDGVYVSKKI
jgi:elongator complex protein 3 (tRNA carboxymethyluridine synthase)